MTLKSPEEVRAELRRRGISISQWSLANNVSVLLVYQLLSGRRKGTRGESHRAAVLLGIKDGEVIDPKNVRAALGPVGAQGCLPSEREN